MRKLGNTLTKQERLSSHIIIDSMFQGKPNSVFAYPFRIVYTEAPATTGDYPMQTGFSVSKRTFKHAVKRNLMKRRMKEAFRKNKHNIYEFLDERNQKIAIMIVFAGKEICDSATVEKGMIKALNKLSALFNSEEQLKS